MTEIHDYVSYNLKAGFFHPKQSKGAKYTWVKDPYRKTK